jgi:hypothetical protein
MVTTSESTENLKDGSPETTMGGQNRPRERHRQYTESSTEQIEQQREQLQLKRNQQTDSETST